MQTRKCKSCNKRNSIEETLFKGVYSFCSKECISNYQKENKSSPKTKNTIRKVSLKKQKRIKEGGSEVEVFKEVEKLDVTCWICGTTIFEPSSITFPHLLSKGQYKAFRLQPNNVARCCSIEHHHQLDSLVLKVRKDLTKLNKLKELILIGDRKEVYNLIKEIGGQKTNIIHTK